MGMTGEEVIRERKGKKVEGAGTEGAEGGVRRGGFGVEVGKKKKRWRGRLRRWEETHFRRRKGRRGAEGGVLLPALQTHSSLCRDITICEHGDVCKYYKNKPRDIGCLSICPPLKYFIKRDFRETTLEFVFGLFIKELMHKLVDLLYKLRR